MKQAAKTSITYGLLIAAALCAGCATSERVAVLTDATSNTRTDTKTMRWSDAPGVTVTKRTLHGGKQEGVEVVTVDNGAITITVIPTRGMNILDVRDSRTGERLLGWDSPVKEVVHPQYMNLESRGGLGWLEGFNEWMVRCGLEFAGHPGRDKFVTNTGDEAEMDLTLHGKVGNIPASRVEVSIDDAPPHRVHVRGVVYERLFYGPKLKLATDLSTEPGSGALHIDDTVTNQGAFDQEFQLIYHCNFGRPLLGEGAHVSAAVQSVTPMNAHAAEGIDGYATYAGPTKGFVEQVYLIEPYADASGRTMALVTNPAGDRAASLSWPIEQLPYLTVWKNTAAEASGYVTGIEPATGFPFNRRVERKAGRVPKLAPGQTRRFQLDVNVYRGRADVERAARAVQAITADRAAKVVREAPSTD
ncbi:MAG: DUF4432 family protein [Phycisphaera sp.]|nr:DUF4432 family protein [Phycisphaera sp.]